MNAPSALTTTVPSTLASIIAEHLDEMLGTASVPDYPNALNGLQVANRRPIHKVAAAVDISQRTIDAAVAAGANLMLVHHGLFWGGLQPLSGGRYHRVRTLIEHDIAVYSTHLPLDRHPSLGNNVLLARALGLEPTGEFARHHGVTIGVRGATARQTSSIVDAARTFARAWGGDVRVTQAEPSRMTHQWAICTGGGALAETLQEAAELGVDTLIVGEGPHWTAVDAPELGLVIIYAGHYATETLGPRALAEYVGTTFGIPWTFVDAPTGL